MEKQNKRPWNANLGVGYVSIMIIFALVCLVIFAVLSLKAASSDEALNKRSGEYLKQYYQADLHAKQILSELDIAADLAAASGFFRDDFPHIVEEKGYSSNNTRSGCEVNFSTPINDRSEIAVSVVFKDTGGYEITRWASRTISDDNDDHLNVWSGE